MPEVELTIDQFSKKGKGVASYRDAKVEVVGGIPGDRVRVELTRKRKGWHKGFLREVIEKSSLRVVPLCAHVPHCGGCSWQEIAYSKQLEEKQARVRTFFSAWLQNREEILRPILPCDEPWRYRNKMEFSFSQNRAGEHFLGLMLAGGKNRVLNLTECHLTSPWFSVVLNAVRNWWVPSGILAYRVNDEGALRTLILREGQRTGDKLVMLTVSGRPEFALTRQQIESFTDTIKKISPQASVFLRIQQIAKGVPTQFYELHLSGPDHIKEKLEINTGRDLRTLTFKISPTSFFQPNTRQAERLYSTALEMVELPPRAQVFDLYAGTSTLGMALSLQAERVVGIEINPHAVFDAEASVLLNGISNLTLHCGDVGKVLTRLREEPGFERPDLAIVDPPRAGLDPLALSHLLALLPNQILYISCNPESQAENIKLLIQGGYQLRALQPVDQFPHTPHIENIAVLYRTSFAVENKFLKHVRYK
jgi:23S rRNA (uracil1939-C5)-methyltransferase